MGNQVDEFMEKSKEDASLELVRAGLRFVSDRALLIELTFVLASYLRAQESGSTPKMSQIGLIWNMVGEVERRSGCDVNYRWDNPDNVKARNSERNKV